MSEKIAFVLKGYPRLSETFIAQEIHALENRGLDITIVSLRHPTDSARHPVHEQIRADTLYLPEYLYQEPLRVIKAWWSVRKLKGYRTAFNTWTTDLKRDRTSNRVRRFGQALVLAHELGPELNWMHAHFLHTPASVTRYAATICSMPWSCSAHAKDIWTISDWEKREKLNDMQWLVTCTRANTEHLTELAGDKANVSLVYHGIDLERFKLSSDAKQVRSGNNGSDVDNPVRLISVGRAVPKKGYDILLEALARLPDTMHWQLEHVGGGPELSSLKEQARKLGIDQHINWSGAMAQPQVIERYIAADLFVLPSRITADGDRDGLPNVLMEAQAHALACLSTDISGIPELIEHNVTGILVAPEDADALQAALSQLISEPNLRSRIGQAGYDRVNQHFDMNNGIDDLETRFRARV